MAATDSPLPRPAAEVRTWDVEADVVVVGYGCAGAAAALEAVATDADVDVLVVDRAGGPGGVSAMAGGLIYLGGGTPIQQACGFPDSTEAMFAFLMAACGPEPDEAKIAAYCEGSLDLFGWLVDQGVPFKAAFHPEPGIEPPNDDGLVYSGGEDAFPYDRIAHPAPRGHKPQTKHAAGWLLMQCLAEAVAATRVQTRFDTVVDRLVLESDGRVAGVVARQFGHEQTIRARDGVVLTAGGFIYNDAMLARHAPHLLQCNFKVGAETDTGAGIQMAQAVGAAVKRMGSGEVALPFTPPRSLVRGLLVNGQGQRFINEDTYYGRVGQEALFGQGGQVYLVVDEEIHEVNRIGMGATWVCPTVAELEAEIGLPAGSLQATVELYNRHAATGHDPVFHKHPDWIKPLEGPFGAVDLRPSAAPYAGFTLGGLETDVDSRVLNVAGEAIPGLFAAGRTTSGVAAFGYCSGLSLGDGLFFGRAAGRAAVRSRRRTGEAG